MRLRMMTYAALLLAASPLSAQQALNPAPKPFVQGERPTAPPSAPPQPNVNAPVTTTLARMQAIAAAAFMQGQAKAASDAVKDDFDDLIKQAMPKADQAKPAPAK